MAPPPQPQRHRAAHPNPNNMPIANMGAAQPAPQQHKNTNIGQQPQRDKKQTIGASLAGGPNPSYNHQQRQMHQQQRQQMQQRQHQQQQQQQQRNKKKESNEPRTLSQPPRLEQHTTSNNTLNYNNNQRQKKQTPPNPQQNPFGPGPSNNANTNAPNLGLPAINGSNPNPSKKSDKNEKDTEGLNKKK